MARRVQKATSATASDNTFGVATDWLAKQKLEWSDVHYTKSSQAIERDVIPLFGKLPVSEISTPMVSSIIETITRRTITRSSCRRDRGRASGVAPAYRQQGTRFPSRTDAPHLTRESVEKAYRVTLGLEGKHTPHGWRAAFSTLARDHGLTRRGRARARSHPRYRRGARLRPRRTPDAAHSANDLVGQSARACGKGRRRRADQAGHA